MAASAVRSSATNAAISARSTSLRDLPRRCAREPFADPSSSRSGNLKAATPCSRSRPTTSPSSRPRPRSRGAEDDERGGPLPHHRIRHRHQREHLRSRGTQSRSSSTSCAGRSRRRGDDDVLLPVHHPEESIGVEHADVAGAEPSVVGEGVDVQRRVDIPHEQLRAPAQDLAALAHRDILAGVVDDAKLGGPDGDAIGRREAAGRIITRAGSRGRHLGRPVRPLAPTAERRRRELHVGRGHAVSPPTANRRTDRSDSRV